MVIKLGCFVVGLLMLLNVLFCVGKSYFVVIYVLECVKIVNWEVYMNCVNIYVVNYLYVCIVVRLCVVSFVFYVIGNVVEGVFMESG